MPAVRTITRPPLSDSVTVHIPEEYRSYSLEIIVLPIMENDFDDISHVSLADGNKPAGRKLGGYEKGFYMSPDFDAPMEDFSEYM